MNFGFVIDNRKCIGCHACTVACKSEHQVPVGVNRTWVKYIEKGEFPDTRRLFSVMRCNHCADAPCVEICPTTALYTRSDGIVDFDNEFTRSLKEEQYLEVFSSDKYYYKELSIIPDYDESKLIPIGVNLLSMDAVLKDAETRNSTFLNILREGLKANSAECKS